MCGIVGKITAGSGVPPELITRMNGCAAHRGPDDSGVFLDGNIGLGHRRLSILDPSPAGHQPMSTGDRRYWIVYNGEVGPTTGLRERAKQHARCQQATACLNLANYPTLHKFRWVFRFATLSKWVGNMIAKGKLSPNANLSNVEKKRIQTAGEQGWRGRNGWPILCTT